MTEKLVKTITLENNQVLKLYDASRKIAGDRWQLTFIARIEIPISDTLSVENDWEMMTADEIEEVLGKTVIFEQKREKFFIDEKEKDNVFKKLYVSFLDNSLSYLSHADFAKRFVFQKYKQKMSQQSWNHT
ncbi:hypothetical protein [Desulfonema magnum]|uniref:Uncharacterized protein n=1 Tax=Desulfonema magnum TaxID=45655 RepID=A0A975BFN4_9BACT|nr:hypothetical protein [Desulfonema magnum]QTA84557.1 Uncharacterized protein dnm_005540 [Desulfonema magnum]